MHFWLACRGFSIASGIFTVLEMEKWLNSYLWTYSVSPSVMCLSSVCTESKLLWRRTDAGILRWNRSCRVFFSCPFPCETNVSSYILRKCLEAQIKWCQGPDLDPGLPFGEPWYRIYKLHCSCFPAGNWTQVPGERVRWLSYVSTQPFLLTTHVPPPAFSCINYMKHCSSRTQDVPVRFKLTT